jgi:plasmid stabilization system protein ParE
MRYRVVTTLEADGDLRATARYIRLDNPRAATAWLKGARQCIKNLAQHPERCPLAPETTSFVEPIRELLYGQGNRGSSGFCMQCSAKQCSCCMCAMGRGNPGKPDRA